MNCARCQVPLDEGDIQCGVCGEIVKPARPAEASPAASDNDTVIQRPRASTPRAAAGVARLGLDPLLFKVSVWWMVACAAMAGIFIAVAFVKYSIEAMYASFVAAGLIAVPLVYIIFGRTVETAMSLRRELTLLAAILAALVGIYFLSLGIKQSDIHVETQGMQEMVTNTNFTKTLVTAIICITVIVGLLPIARMVFKGTSFSTELRGHQADAQTEIQAKTADNQNAYELRKLELQHELEIRKLELEKEKLRMENDRLTLLADNRMQLLTNESGQAAAAEATSTVSAKV